MPAPKFITGADGRVFMVVTPVESLLRSTMVKQVIGRGDQFVVDMNTGKLTILHTPAPKVPELKFTINFPASRTIAPIHCTTTAQVIFHVNDYRDRWGECEMLINVSKGELNDGVSASDKDSMDIIIKRLMTAVDYVNKA
jgi:hypothetical protein